MRQVSVCNNTKLISTLTLLIMLLPFSAIAVEPVQEKNETAAYSFGIVPQQSAKRLATLWGPILSYLSNKTGLKLQFKTAKNIPTFEQQLADGKYDFAYMNPYHFTVYNNKPGYKAIAARKNQAISGIIVTRKDSDIESLNMLADKSLAFPSPAAFAATILPQAELKNEGINFKAKYVSSHDSVYLTVAKGLLPAGGGVKRTLNNTPEEIRKQLKILWTSKKHTPHAFAAHPRINSEAYKIIQNALLDMESDPEGKVLLQSLKIKHGLIRANDSDWDDVRSLNINLLDKTK